MKQVVIQRDKLEEIEQLVHQITDGDQILLGVFNLLVPAESLGSNELELHNKFVEAIYNNSERGHRIKRIIKEHLNSQQNKL
jgi:hypothetical protein